MQQRASNGTACRQLMYHTPFQTNYTALTESGADWVVKHGITFVGIDYLSIATYEELAPAHQSLMRVVYMHLLHSEPALALQHWIMSVCKGIFSDFTRSHALLITCDDLLCMLSRPVLGTLT